jgi:pimeloyl-ACP methyl ester carboxylesterase
VPDAAVEGATVHYQTAGNGFPLVLLHGIGSNSRSWHRQIAGLSDTFKVIAWDAPGYGRSSDPPPDAKPSISFYVDRLRQMLDAMDIHNVALLGHSKGGVVAQQFYRRHPEYVRALILADTRHIASHEALAQRLAAIRTMTPEQLAAERAPKLLSEGASPELLRETISIMSEVRAAGYAFAAMALAESDTTGILRSLNVPALLIWGDHDRITPVWQELPQGARLEIIPGAGHLSYVEQPEQFNEVVRNFVLKAL